MAGVGGRHCSHCSVGYLVDLMEEQFDMFIGMVLYSIFMV